MAETTSRRDKLYVLGLWVLSTALAGATLELSPHTMLDFRWEPAAQELNALVTQIARRVHSAPQVPSASVWHKSLTRMHSVQGAPLAYYTPCRNACYTPFRNGFGLRRIVDELFCPSCMLSTIKASACDYHCWRSRLHLWLHLLTLYALGGHVRQCGVPGHTSAQQHAPLTISAPGSFRHAHHCMMNRLDAGRSRHCSPSGAAEGGADAFGWAAGGSASKRRCPPGQDHGSGRDAAACDEAVPHAGKLPGSCHAAGNRSTCSGCPPVGEGLHSHLPRKQIYAPFSK